MFESVLLIRCVYSVTDEGFHCACRESSKPRYTSPDNPAYKESTNQIIWSQTTKNQNTQQNKPTNNDNEQQIKAKNKTNKLIKNLHELGENGDVKDAKVSDGKVVDAAATEAQQVEQTTSAPKSAGPEQVKPTVSEEATALQESGEKGDDRM